MKTINDYAERIEELSREDGSLYFKGFEVYNKGLQIDFEKNNEDCNYILYVDGNDVLGYNALMTAISFDYGQRKPELKDKKTIEDVIKLNENISEKLNFNNLTVRVGNDFAKEVCEKRNYDFEDKNSYQVAVKKIRKKKI